MGEGIIDALGRIGHPEVVGVILLGSIIGFTFGIIPGLGGTIALSMMLPFSLLLEPRTAMYFYAGIMGAVAFGGSVPAILIRVPGRGSDVAATFDGYPMTERGEGSRALGISAIASLLGAIFGIVILVAALPLVKVIVLAMGPPEFFILIIWGLSACIVISKANLIKGLFSACLGLVFSFFGAAPATTTSRWAFGTSYLEYAKGLPLIPFVVGLFAIGQMIKLSIKGRIVTDERVTVIGGYWRSTIDGFKEIIRHKICFFRSSTIGTLVGIIPGIGATAAAYFAYLAAVQSSKKPETFGQGNPEGLLAVEAANDAKDGGALLTTLAFGIPGSLEMAVLLVALILHGVTPGPMLVREHPDIVWSLIFGLLISNTVVSTVGLMIATKMAFIARIKAGFLIPVVVVTCFIGIYMYHENVMDVLLAVIVGFLSFGLEKYGFPLVPLAIAFVLGRLGEVFFHQSLGVGWGSYFIFFTRPISVGLILLILVTFALPYLTPLLTKRRRNLRT